MGLIYWWARLASQMPALANFFTQTPVLRDIAKWLGGIAPQRQLPRFARQTFKDWFRARVPAAHAPNMPVAILWPDTFTNHFHPEIAKAGVEVLEAAGYEVWVPEKSLCCGRPLYDFGMLETAKRMLRQILDTMRPQIRAGIPVVGLEPSCVAVFRDEMPNFFPYDEDAKRLQDQTFLLSEFLNQHAQDFEIPPLHQKAMVHGHCHHKSVMGLDDERAVLKKLGLDFEIPEDGCCGMAGSFGFERGDHYEVSIACGERALLPAVRDAGAETLVVANGFSCQEQIAQTTNRRALHLAEVIRMALQQNGAGHSETDGLVRKKNSRREILPMAALGAAAVLVGVALESALTGRR